MHLDINGVIPMSSQNSEPGVREVNACLAKSISVFCSTVRIPLKGERQVCFPTYCINTNDSRSKNMTGRHKVRIKILFLKKNVHKTDWQDYFLYVISHNKYRT
jgi:hypothetical protein